MGGLGGWGGGVTGFLKGGGNGPVGVRGDGLKTVRESRGRNRVFELDGNAAPVFFFLI